MIVQICGTCYTQFNGTASKESDGFSGLLEVAELLHTMGQFAKPF